MLPTFECLFSKFDGIERLPDGIEPTFERLFLKFDGLFSKFERLFSKFDGIEQLSDASLLLFDGFDFLFERINCLLEHMDFPFDCITCLSVAIACGRAHIVCLLGGMWWLFDKASKYLVYTALFQDTIKNLITEFAA